MFLELTKLSKVFAGRDGSGDVAAVDNVTIPITKGQLVTLLGPSGCGKTTTLPSIYVTHDQEEAMVLSDQIVIMNKGRVEQMGSAVAIYRRRGHNFCIVQYGYHKDSQFIRQVG